jgi:tRNA(fMet)-specific endonuclease VapC
MLLLDTNICIALLKGDAAVRTLVRGTGLNQLGIPAIVFAELAYGVQKSKQKAAALLAYEELERTYRAVDFDSKAAIEYGRIRALLREKGTTIGPNDLLIAATAISCGAELVTRNVREFSRVPGLRWRTA